jgi:hypothetical protein
MIPNSNTYGQSHVAVRIFDNSKQPTGKVHVHKKATTISLSSFETEKKLNVFSPLKAKRICFI